MGIYIKLLEIYRSIRRRALFYQHIAIPATIIPYICNWIRKINQCLGRSHAVDAISMRHHICYRENDTQVGKRECDCKMLTVVNTFTSTGRREKVDRQLVRSFIGMGMGIQQHHWSSQLADELHKPRRKRYQKRIVFAKQVDDIWAADLVNMSPFSRSNGGYSYLLIVIDVFSKFGWIVPLKTITGKEVASTFRRLFITSTPSRLWTDNGTEFYNKELKAILAANSATHYSADNEEKTIVVGRWNRTMKNIMRKYFTENNTQNYIDVWPSMVEKYNNTYHCSTKRNQQMRVTQQTINMYTMHSMPR